MAVVDNGPEKKSWKPGKRDAFFLAFITAVILLLVYGTGERTTKPTPNDDTHQQASTRAVCMACHGADSVHPQPKHHTKADQCFQCHVQPEGWAGIR
ncbi:MAG: hypothetical protein R8K54_06275 [Mariprofundaceae bacterium]